MAVPIYTPTIHPDAGDLRTFSHRCQFLKLGRSFAGHPMTIIATAWR
ncbi:hypothetical protein [Sphingobium sp. SA916]|nr:hypothetical protein [Sphingobium sp. SA916]